MIRYLPTKQNNGRQSSQNRVIALRVLGPDSYLCCQCVLAPSHRQPVLTVACGQPVGPQPTSLTSFELRSLSLQLVDRRHASSNLSHTRQLSACITAILHPTSFHPNFSLLILRRTYEIYKFITLPLSELTRGWFTIYSIKETFSKPSMVYPLREVMITLRDFCVAHLPLQ